MVTIKRFLADRCELCGQTDVIEVYHIRKLADLNKLGQLQLPWAEAMAKRRRKSLVVCGACHGLILDAQYTRVVLTWWAGYPPLSLARSLAQ